jgi:hypothetical protein
MDLPDKPPGMHWSPYNRLAERFEHQNNIWTIAMIRTPHLFAMCFFFVNLSIFSEPFRVQERVM